MQSRSCCASNSSRSHASPADACRLTPQQVHVWRLPLGRVAGAVCDNPWRGTAAGAVPPLLYHRVRAHQRGFKGCPQETHATAAARRCGGVDAPLPVKAHQQEGVKRRHNMRRLLRHQLGLRRGQRLAFVGFMGDHVWQALAVATTMSEGGIDPPRSLPGRIVYATFLFLLLVMLSMFTANTGEAGGLQ